MIHPLDTVAAVGRGTIGAVRRTGSIAMFGVIGLSHAMRPPFYARMFLQSFIEFAFFSLPVVALTAVFSGMVIALQSYTGFARFNAEGATASVVVLSVVRELGPVLAGLMVAGRVGAAMAAELGITPESEVNIYCFKGARASNAFVALTEAGFSNLRIYFASWNEWACDPSLPIETGMPDPKRPAIAFQLPATVGA